jgi:hypothetical protein
MDRFGIHIEDFNKILSVCRTNRWAVIFNVPVQSHVDLHVRQLVAWSVGFIARFTPVDSM